MRDITHDDAGGTPVCTRDDLPPLTVDVIDNGQSDHRLLRWQSSLLRPPLVYVIVTRRLWRSFGDNIFQADLLASALCVVCDEQQWNGLDGDGLVKLYHWINSFLFRPRSVAVDRPTRGSMTNAGQRNVCCGHLSALHVIPRLCRTLRIRPYIGVAR